MLVLTRKLGEVIRVGEAITVRVLEVKGNQVRLGVEAPADVRIYREEVYRAIHKETDERMLPGPHDLDEADPPWRSPDGKPSGAGGSR